MHINSVDLHRFKQFKKSKIVLKSGVSLVVGGNNSGKSTLLHALAIWEFCKTILEFSKGRRAWVSGTTNQGIGIGLAEFSPIGVPSLKHLWNNLKTQKIDEPDGYTLKIKAAWPKGNDQEAYLEFGLSLANDRLFIKTTSSTLSIADLETEDGKVIEGVVPRIAYLPPFAGITDRESKSSLAVRNRLIGQGLSGGIIRNVLYDMWEHNRRERQRLRGDKSKIGSEDLARLRATDPWEILLKTMGELFQTSLLVEEFDERYHTFIHIETIRGNWTGLSIRKAANDSPRDLMVEGGGFLQWLSVYALALTPGVDIVLLDEPDAHLHCSLQTELVNRLSLLTSAGQKQVLMATHSTELIKNTDYESIVEVKKGAASYLGQDSRKVGVLAGLGANFSPLLHALSEKKRMLIVEGDFDENILKVWAAIAGVDWPQNVVIWKWTGGHKERRQLFLQLKRDIPDLRAVSVRDRDEEPDGSVNDDLLDKSHSSSNDGFTAFKWRRRHIENYLLHPSSVARAANITLDEAIAFFSANHGIAIPANPVNSNVVIAIRDARGKEILSEGPLSLESVLKVNRYDLAKAMLPTELATDVQTFLLRLTEFAAA